MKKKYLIFIFVIVGICLFPLSFLKAQVIGIQWNTFLGSSNWDYGRDIALDSSGNIYVTGSSDATWGSPVHAHSIGYDAFVAKVNSNGNMLWNTFLGGSIDDAGHSLASDGAGNVFVTGISEASWGSPINPFSGSIDVFVAKLDTNGNILWNTFLGSGNDDRGYGIALDNSGNMYIIGYSNTSWGSPLNAHSGGNDAFVAKLDNSGNLVWNTFLGGEDEDYGYDIESDSTGNVYVTGESDATWGSPVYAHSGGYDAFVAGMDSSGNLLWNTFLGSSNYDEGNAISLDSSGNIYVTGESDATWGSPVNAHSGSGDAYVACMDSSGNLLWNTFLGSSNYDEGNAISLDSSGNIYVTGESDATWGSPVNAYNGSADAYVAGMDSSGNLLWNTFLGSASFDKGNAIALNSSGNIYVIGFSYSSWGSPINPHSGADDAFVTKITPQPIPDINANGSDGPISITQSDTLQIKVSLITYGLTDKADWWLLTHSPFGWYYYDYSTMKWKPGKNVTRQGRLMDLNPKTVLNTSGLKTGNYTFYFGVDMNMDGKVTHSSLYYDEVQVTVTSD
jgi:hypothetical protein